MFAESEVVALVAKGVPKEDIIRGLNASVAEQVCCMVARLRARGPYVMTGGVAKNAGVVAALRERLNDYMPAYRRAANCGSTRRGHHRGAGGRSHGLIVRWTNN